MKRLLLGLTLVLLAAQVHAVPLRSLGNLTPTNPEVPSPKFSGTYSQMLSEPATLLQGGDTWDTTDTQAEYIWNLPAQTWVFSLSIAVTPTPTITLSPTITPTFTKTTTPNASFSPTPATSSTPTPLPTPAMMVGAFTSSGQLVPGSIQDSAWHLYGGFPNDENILAANSPGYAGNTTGGIGSFNTFTVYSFIDTPSMASIRLSNVSIDFTVGNGSNNFTFDNTGINSQGNPLIMSFNSGISFIGGGGIEMGSNTTTSNISGVANIGADGILLSNGVSVWSTPGVISSPVPGVTGLSPDGSAFTMGLRTSFGPIPTPNILSGFVTLANDLTPVAVSNTNFSANTKMVVTAKNSVTGVVNSFGVTCISGACSIVGTAVGAVTGMWIAQP